MKELAGHQKGILTASWCPNDSSLLLSAGKDNRTLCWDPNAGELLCELPPAANWTFDVQWSPRIPAILSSCSFDGEVAVFSLQDASAAATSGAAGGAVAKRSMRAPKWLRRPCGASFGFGGKLAIFNNGLGTALTLEVVSDTSVVRRAEELQNAVQSGKLSSFCEQKASSSRSEKDAAEWKLMQVLCSQQQRELLFSYLDVAQPAGEDGDSAPPIPGPKELVSDDASPGTSTKSTSAPTVIESTHPHLKSAMLQGHFEAAANFCMRAGRVSDALVLAASGGPELWKAIRDEYLLSCSSPFMKTLNAVVHQVTYVLCFAKRPVCCLLLSASLCDGRTLRSMWQSRN